MGNNMPLEQIQQQIDAEEQYTKTRFESQMAILRTLDDKTKVPHLLIELRNLGFVEICGKDTGAIYQRLDGWLRNNLGCAPSTSTLKTAAITVNGCCGPENQRGEQVIPRQPWDEVCDAIYICGTHLTDGNVQGNGTFISSGNQGYNNMGKLTMKVVDFMTNECGWGLQLCDGNNNGRWGQIRDQQIKFKAPHPLNLIAPHVMIELRQCGFIELNGKLESGGLLQKLDQWFLQKWQASRCANDPNMCDVQYSTMAFKSRGSEGENNMGMRTMEIVDFMTQQCAWTLITCTGGNFGRTGAMREQQMIFRNDEFVQHGENHVMIELRDIGYIEVNGLHDAGALTQQLDAFIKNTWLGRDYQKGFWEGSEEYCDKKYTMPPGFYYRSGLTNNLGKRTIELAQWMGTQGWVLLLCNGGNICDHSGYNIKREQQIKFTKARENEWQKAQAPVMMVEIRAVPVDRYGNFEGYIEVNGPDVNGIYQQLANYISQSMLGSPVGRTAFCDYLFRCNCLRMKNATNSWYDARYNGLLNGENNFGRYTMRLCDFMVDHIGEWELIVCNGNNVDAQFRINKDDTISVTSKEQQLIFRHRPGGRAVFMAVKESATLGRAPLQAPHYWKDNTKKGLSPHEMVPASDEEKKWMQELLTHTYKKKATRDRWKGTLADRFTVVSVLRSENPALWEKYATRRGEVMKNMKGAGSEGAEFVVPKTVDASPMPNGLSKRLVHPKLGNPTNEAYLLHGTNPTGATAILNSAFTVDLAGASAGTMFGPGVYLAEASSKADEYAKDENTGSAYDGLFALIVCRCVLGRAFVTETPGNYADQVTSGLHDVCVGDREKAVGTYREFIFFHEGSIYPEYAVFYRREWDDPAAAAAAAAAQAASAGPASKPTVSAMPNVQAIAPQQVQMQMASAHRFLDVKVPEGVGPGTKLQVQAPDGTVLQAEVPHGVSGGSSFRVQY